MSHNSCQLLLKRSHCISAKATTLYNNTYPHQLSLLFHASPHRTLYTPILLHTYNYTVPLMTSVYVCPAQWNPSSTQSLSCSASVSLPHHTPSTTSHKHWIYQTTCQARSTKFIIILQPDISILYVGQTRYQSKSGIFKSHFSFKFRFFLESIKCSFIFATLLVHTTMLTIPPTIPSFTSVNFHPPFSSHYLFTKPSLQTLATLPSSIRQPFLAFLFSHIVIITIPTKNPFPHLDHQASSGFVKGPRNKRVLCGVTMF